MRLLLGSMTGWVGFALRTKTSMFFQAGLRRRDEEATAVEADGEIRSKLTILFKAMPRDLPRPMLLALSLVVGCGSDSLC